MQTINERKSFNELQNIKQKVAMNGCLVSELIWNYPSTSFTVHDLVLSARHIFAAVGAAVAVESFSISH